MDKTEHSGVTVRIHIKWDDGAETIDCPLGEPARRDEAAEDSGAQNITVSLLAEKERHARELFAERDRLVGVIQDKDQRIEGLTRELSAAYGSLNAYRAGRLCAPQIVLDAIAERERQIGKEGFYPDADDGYTGGEMASAAAAYAAHAANSQEKRSSTTPFRLWPWAMGWWKPSPDDPRRDIVKAIALLFAEGERLDRRAAKENGHV